MACHSKGFQSRLPDFYQWAYRASSSCEQPQADAVKRRGCRCIVVRCLRARHGELAQLVERVHGMDEVSGSSPLFSTSDQAQGQESSTSPRHTSSSIGVRATCLLRLPFSSSSEQPTSAAAWATFDLPRKQRSIASSIDKAVND